MRLPEADYLKQMIEEEKRRMRNQSAAGGGTPVFEETAAGGIRWIGYDTDNSREETMTQTAQGQGPRGSWVSGPPVVFHDGQTTTSLTSGTIRDHIDERLAVLSGNIAVLMEETLQLHCELLGPYLFPGQEPEAGEADGGWLTLLLGNVDSMIVRTGQVANALRAVREACKKSR